MALRPFMTQGVVPQTLLNSFTAGNAPQGGVAMTAPMTPRTMAAPAAPAPAATQGPDSLAEMTRLLSGDLSGSLSSGDKLLALSGLLRSATRSGRRAGITPQQVIGQLQQQKVAEVQNRLQVEQLRMAEAQRRQQITDTVEFAKTLPESKQKAFLALPVEKRVERMDTEAFRQQQWVGTFVDDKGKTRNRYLDGTTELADYSLPSETIIETYDVNGDGVNERVVLDKITKLPMQKADGTTMFYPLGMSPAEIAADIDRDLSRSVTIRGQNISAARGGGGGGGGGKSRNVPREIFNSLGQRVLAEFDPVTRKDYVPGTNTVVQRGVTPATGWSALNQGNPGGKPLFTPGPR
jgi:hypothetical protein